MAKRKSRPKTKPTMTARSLTRKQPGKRVGQAEVLERIREMITSQTFRRNELLSEQGLVERLEGMGLEVSKQPVRRALVQLETERIVQILPQRGTLICWPDPSELRQIWDSRAATEDFVLCRLARLPEVDLTQVNKKQNELRQLAELPMTVSEVKEVYSTFLENDEQFHELLAYAAEYPELSYQLRTLRTRLKMLARSNPQDIRLRMKEVVTEHDDILTALHPRPVKDSSKSRLLPDTNSLRLALRIHLRNSAFDWTIGGEGVRGNFRSHANRNPYLDLPDSLAVASENVNISPAHLLALRSVLELFAVRRVAVQKNVDLTPLHRLHATMRDILSQPITDERQLEFIKCDIDFHASLCFLSGMLFAEDATCFVWQKIYQLLDYKLSMETMKSIVIEHDSIVHALSERGAAAPAEMAMRAHLMSAIVRFKKSLDSSESAKPVELDRIAEDFRNFVMVFSPTGTDGTASTGT